VTLILLAALGIVEAAAWHWRMRTAVGASVAASTAAAFLVTVTRIAFVGAGASAVMAREPWPLLIVAYAVPATLATVVVHSHSQRKAVA
jgi:hypothetical protein